MSIATKRTTKPKPAPAPRASLQNLFPGRAFIAADPGAACGLAVFDAHGRLVRAVQCKLLDGVELVRELHLPIAVEKPQIYPHARARPNDLITLAVRAGQLIGAAPRGEAITVLPREWKGQNDKSVTQRRVIALLDGAERAYLAGVTAAMKPSAKDDDMQDAIALGLFAAGRADFLRPNG